MEDEDEFVDAREGQEDIRDDDYISGDDDFGDFAEEESTKEEIEKEKDQHAFRISAQQTQPPVPPDPSEGPSIPLPDFKNKTREEIRQEALRFINLTFSTDPSPSNAPAQEDTITESNDESERSQSLWSQLTAPVSLQPPDWKRSRIRRLFLVSLGIPVNLDEILPAKKTKKLILPSTTISAEEEEEVDNHNRSTQGSRKRVSAPQFDILAARHLSATSTLALSNLNVEELQAHLAKLHEETKRASETLTYWLSRREEAVHEKESLESVIESLVGWTERQRKGTTGIAMVPGRVKSGGRASSPAPIGRKESVRKAKK